MTKQLLGFVFGYLMLGLVASGPAGAEECGGSITDDEALKAEDARYVAQTTGDFASLDRLLGEDLVYIHSSGAVDGKASYIESQRSNTVRYRSMRRSNVKVRTYGCLAILTGTANFDVTVKGEDRSVELLFHTIWAKRAAGVQFISWQATAAPK